MVNNSSWLVLLLLHFALPQTTDKYSDEDRPYKFGFNIQGYQHRQEEKDEKGLIKGEYGFITADGYYRVTVYATDENGDFRILSMKNYYVGFPPEDPTTTPGPASDRARQPQLPPSLGKAEGPAGRALNADKKNDGTPKAFTRPQGIAACSDCSIPTTTQRTNQPNELLNRGDFRTGTTGGENLGSSFGQGPAGRQGRVQGFPQGPARGNAQIPQQKQTLFPATARGFPEEPAPQFPSGRFQGETPRTSTRLSEELGSNAPSGPRGSLGGGQSPIGGGGFSPNTSGRAFGSPGGIPKGRSDFTQANQLDDTPLRRPQIGEVRDGLPPGVTVNDIKDLLYTFNYTVGFHGHHEDGFRNGDKLGDYFFDGRDGVERKVEYLANEFGYQPNITLIDLPENDVRRPNEQTEKEYGLKGYEFKWFYRK